MTPSKLSQPTTLYRPDFRVNGEGPGSTLYTIEPLTERARAWIAENVSAEPYQWFGGALAVEHRYITDLVDGIVRDGFIVEGV